MALRTLTRLILPAAAVIAVSTARVLNGDRRPPPAEAAAPDTAAKSQTPLRRFWQIAMATKDEVSRDNASIVAAGVAFYALLSLFPALVAAVSLFGLVADPVQIEEQLASFGGMLPGDAQSLIATQLNRIVSTSSSALSLGAITAIVFALYSASAGVKAMITALNIAYGEVERRGIVRLYLEALLLTLCGIVFGVFSLLLIVVLPVVLIVLGDYIGLGEVLSAVVSLLRWPLLAGVFLFGLGVLYRFGPSRRQPRWEILSWGGVVATVLWLLGSAAFSFYVANFANYNKTYGAIGSVIILLMWFYVSAFIVIVGAEVNAVLERRRQGTTKDPQAASAA